MADPNPFLDFVSAVKAAGGNWWPEELTVRGEPGNSDGGTIKGAHIVVGAQFPNPIPGQAPVRQLSPPMPLSVAPDSIDLAALFPEALKVAMRDLEAARAQVVALTEQVASITAERDAANDKLAKVAEAIA